MKNLENKKYGEFIIKVPLLAIHDWEMLLENIKLPVFEIKKYNTHFVKFLKRRKNENNS